MEVKVTQLLHVLLRIEDHVPTKADKALKGLGLSRCAHFPHAPLAAATLAFFSSIPRMLHVPFFPLKSLSTCSSLYLECSPPPFTWLTLILSQTSV